MKHFILPLVLLCGCPTKSEAPATEAPAVSEVPAVPATETPAVPATETPVADAAAPVADPGSIPAEPAAQ